MSKIMFHLYWVTWHILNNIGTSFTWHAIKMGCFLCLTPHNFIFSKCLKLLKAESKGNLEVTAAIHLLWGWFSYPLLRTIGVRDRPCTTRLSTSITNLLVPITKKPFTMTLIAKHYQDNSIVSCALCVVFFYSNVRAFDFNDDDAFWDLLICLESSLSLYGLIIWKCFILQTHHL